MRSNLLFIVAMAASTAACSSSTNQGLPDLSMPGGPSDMAGFANRDFAGQDLAIRPGSDLAMVASTDLAGMAAGNTVNGTITVAGNPINYNTVVTSLWIGSPDPDPRSTPTVVYLFDKVVTCADLQMHMWDQQKLADGSKIVELKTFGNTPKAYPVMPPPGGAPGDALVNVGVSHPAGADEQVGNGGTVTIATITANTNVTGSFSLTFGANNETLMGTFNAPYCAGGVEP